MKRSTLKRFLPLAAIAGIQLVILAALPADVDGQVASFALLVSAVAVIVVGFGIAGFAMWRDRKSLVVRYAPLIALALVQLMIMGLAPSRAPAETAFGDQEGLFNEEGEFDPGALDEGLLPGEEGEGGAEGGTTGGTSSTGSGGSGTGGVAAPGDTSHCVDGRQYDPAIYYYAPVCQPKSSGTNPGATYQGVTSDTIKIIRYSGKPNEAVDAIARAQGAYFTAEQVQGFAVGAAKFINQHYELYGRRVQIKVVKGQCDVVPPDYPCLRGDVQEINRGEKPFFLLWNTPVASPFFDEASALRLPNAGGWNFRDSFSNARAPYHWDVFISGTQMANHVGEFYCKYLHGKKAEYADGGRKNPANPIWERDRVLGVISTNDPENLNMVKVDFKNALAKCGAKFEKEYYYAQDISTAQQQRDAALAAMREPPEATTIVCFCEHIAPHFLFAEAEENRYYPEYISPGNGIVDLDRVAQPFGTVVPPQNVQWNNAVGLSSDGAQEDQSNTVAHRVWKESGNSGNPPYEAASIDWKYYALVADLIQASGPTLTPVNMAKGIFAQPARGGANVNIPRYSLRPGDYSLADDMRMVYWTKTVPSSYNGRACGNREDFSCSGGSYVNIFDRRFLLGQYPSGNLNIPPYNQR